MLKKTLAVMLIVCMMLSVFPAVAFANEPGATAGDSSSESYPAFLERLKELEALAAVYAAENEKDAYALVLNYIRTGANKYNDSLWAGVAGAEETAFVAYVQAQDAANGTTVSALRSIEPITVPNGDIIDIQHQYAVLDIASYQSRNSALVANSYKDFGGWLGDLGDLVYQVYRADLDCVTDFEASVENIRLHYLGVDFGGDAFDLEDIHADLDAVKLISRHEETGASISSLMEAYYTSDLTDADRAASFLAIRYPGVNTIAGLRQKVHQDYSDNFMALALESKRNVNRNEHPEWIKAVCYAWADYICGEAGITEFGEYAPDESDPSALGGDVYKVFSSQTTTLAPGVTQTVRLANTAKNKQIAYYMATADLRRPDVAVYAGFKDYSPDTTKWGMQSVIDQTVAAKAAHADENFNVVVGMNGDFYNMSTGKPTGALIMEGTEYHAASGWPFFAILNDGTPIIGSAADYSKYRSQIKEAVGGRDMLVVNGKIAAGSFDDYLQVYASRTCVGITAEGKVVFLVVDGRQEPWSVGGTVYELAQIMIDAGCVTALNLDGGGSSTFATKEEGSDELAVINRPSDGFERRVSSSLMIVSSAVVSNELHHANLNTESAYLVPCASAKINAVGVSETGNSAPLPETAEWVVSDDSVGYMNGDVFEADFYGDVTISLVDGERTLGSVDLHVVVPDTIAFEPAEIDALYGETVTLPLTAHYNSNPVLLPEDPLYVDSVVHMHLSNPAAGSLDGLELTVAGDDCGVRSTTVTAVLWDDESVTCEGTVRLYRSDEASFDFNNCIAGDRKLAWNRTVTNTTTSDNAVYYREDPDEGMTIDYTFALDMNDLVIPDNVAQALPMVAAFMGEDQVDGTTTAWELLLMLAERISPTTTVTITIDVDPRLTVDISDMLISCQYFEETDSVYDPANSRIKLTFNWIKVYGPIDPGTANPLCIVSGIKAQLRDGVRWDDHNEIELVNSGAITYNARLRSNQAYQLAKGALAEQYGLRPYDNTANLENDKGAEFSSTHVLFEDRFVLNNTDLEGWVTVENGKSAYYVNNDRVTGLQFVTAPDGTGPFWYDFGEDGISRGKYSGLFSMDGKQYYAVLGERITGWRYINDSYYYFNPSNYAAMDGVTTIGGFTYTFENYKLIRGDLVQRGSDWKYAWAGSFYRNGWFELDGHKYFARPSEKLCTGLSRVEPYGGGEKTLLHIFDENGVWHEEIDGLYEMDGDTYLADHGILVEYPGLVEVDGYLYYFANTNKMVKDRTYWISKTNDILPEGAYTFGPDGRMVTHNQEKNGIVEEDGSLWYYQKGVRVYAGLIRIDGDYYYVKTSGEVIHGKIYWITKTNGLMEEKAYTFAADGKMIDPPGAQPDPGTDPGTVPGVKNGIVAENGGLWYYVNGVLTYAGLIRIDGYYYYVRTGGEVVHGRSYWITKTNGLLPERSYNFDSQGKMTNAPGGQPQEPDPGTGTVPEVKNGIVAEDGSLWYYVNGKLDYAGLILIDGSYYYVKTSGEVVHGRSYWITKTNGLMKEKAYTFDADGKMTDATESQPDPGTLPEVKNGIEDFKYYVNGKLTYAGLIKIGDDYYYVKTTGDVIHGRSYWITKTNNLLKEKSYIFDENGVITNPETGLIEPDPGTTPDVKNGIVAENDSLWYYVDGVLTYAGLIRIDDAYYYVKSSGEVVHGRSYWISKTNGLMPEKSYIFDADGKIINPFVA